jgi:hypothetical protein
MTISTDDDELLTALEARTFIGGRRKPISEAMLWRGVKAGVYTAPDKIGPQAVRFKKSQLRADLARLNEREAANETTAA